MEPDFQFTHFDPSTDTDRIFNAFKRPSWTLLCSASLFIHFELYKKSHSGQRITKINIFSSKDRKINKKPLFSSIRFGLSFSILKRIREFSFFEIRFGVLFYEYETCFGSITIRKAHPTLLRGGIK